jgi:hypothetical protein
LLWDRFHHGDVIQIIILTWLLAVDADFYLGDGKRIVCILNCQMKQDNF